MRVCVYVRERERERDSMCRHSDFLKGVIVTFCIYTHSDAKILTQITLYANLALSKALNTFRNLEQSDITACKRLNHTMAFPQCLIGT